MSCPLRLWSYFRIVFILEIFSSPNTRTTSIHITWFWIQLQNSLPAPPPPHHESSGVPKSPSKNYFCLKNFSFNTGDEEISFPNDPFQPKTFFRKLFCFSMNPIKITTTLFLSASPPKRQTQSCICAWPAAVLKRQGLQFVHCRRLSPAAQALLSCHTALSILLEHGASSGGDFIMPHYTRDKWNIQLTAACWRDIQMQ